jgi:HEAT repeat protein
MICRLGLCLIMILVAGPALAAKPPAKPATAKLPPKAKLAALAKSASECKIYHPQRCDPLKQMVALGNRLGPYAIELVESSEKPLRLVGLSLLGELSVQSEGLRALKLVRNPDPEIQVAAINAVGRLLPEGALTELSAILGSEVVNVKIAAAAALARVKSPAAIEPLLAALDHFHPMVRATVARTLGTIGDRRVVMDLLARLADGELQRPARVAVIEALGTLGDKRAVPMLVLQVSFNEPSIRRSALRTLGMLKDDRAVAALTPLLRTADYALDALKTLGRIGSPDAIPALVRVVAERSLPMPVLKEAFWSLGSIKSPATVPALTPLLRDADLQIAAWAAEALGRIGERSAAEALLEALGRGDPELKTMALYGLEEISGKRLGDDAKAWAPWVFAPEDE